jgi:type III secretion protein V
VSGSAKVAWGEAVLAVLVVAIVAMMIVPLPTPLVDLLIAANLTFSVLLLATALYMREALSFAAFPTLILISTLYRLALNVSSTRLILLQADAGTIIEAFGRFVVRGDYAVGALVFLILTLIQFIVIARGAERVAEVGARFTLDALPGKQLAIDAELRAGSLGVDSARKARRSLQRESQFYGAMDGAMKFVKGDAIAGLVITAINFLGGVGIGVMGRDLALPSSLATYGLLTIGDGLVTQIPSLLGSTAAALVVTRVASDRESGSLASDIAQQLFADRRVLGAAIALLLALALIPGLPSWPFALMALLCTALVLRAARSKREARQTDSSPLSQEPLVVELGRALAERVIVRGAPSEAFTTALQGVRGRVEQLGVGWPEMQVRAEAALEETVFRVLIRELPSPECKLVAPNDTLEASLAEAIAATVQRRAHELVQLEQVQRMLDTLALHAPTLVRGAVPTAISLSTLSEVLRLLVREGVSVRWLDEILQTALEHPGAAPVVLAEQVRKALCARICHQLSPDGNIHLLRLAPELEEALRDGLREPPEGNPWLALPPDLARDIQTAISRAARKTAAPRALVVDGRLRRHVRELCDDPSVDLAVLATTELTNTVTIVSSGIVSP